MKTILIIDDDLHIGNMLEEILRKRRIWSFTGIFRNRSIAGAF